MFILRTLVLLVALVAFVATEPVSAASESFVFRLPNTVVDTSIHVFKESDDCGLIVEYVQQTHTLEKQVISDGVIRALPRMMTTVRDGDTFTLWSHGEMGSGANAGNGILICRSGKLYNKGDDPLLIRK